VEEERARFHFMAESMPQKIFTATPEGMVDYVNSRWPEFAGRSIPDLIGGEWAQLLHPDDREASIGGWMEAVKSGNTYTSEQRFLRRDGVYRWHLSRAQAMRDQEGRITMWIGSNTDIHEQKEKEEELRRANEDLRQFAYSASHDLQEPIRNVAVFSELIERKLAPVIDEEGRQFLVYLQEGARRLSRMVSGLLAYTSASSADLSAAPVNAGVVLTRVLTTLEGIIRENEAVITWDELPRVHMGELHLEQIFQNLIGNAIKYRSERQPRIHVSAKEVGEAWRFSVSDNGIGIDPQYKEKIFGLFKRLSRQSKYGGTGIGLAICQRIVERYGGHIWVEGQLGEGATFYFTIPQRPQPARSTAV
jgi:PAS domain S-box-containing protein